MGLSAVFLDCDSLCGADLDRRELAKAFTRISWYEHTAPQEVVTRLQGTDVAIVSDIQLDEAAFSVLSSLKLVLVAATGTDNIDHAAAKRHGITVCHCQDYATGSLAQHAFSLLLALTNQIINYHRLVEDGAWQRATSFCVPSYPLNELTGKTIGIMGYGASGRRMAAMASAFGMIVKVAAP